MTFPIVIYVTHDEDEGFLLAHETDVEALTQGETTKVGRYVLDVVKTGKLVAEFSE